MTEKIPAVAHEALTLDERLTMSFERWLERIEPPFADSVARVMADPEAAELIATAPGSRGAHQAWRGGYREHLRQTMMLASGLYETVRASGAIEALPEREQFCESDALVVMFLHDIEKPYMLAVEADGQIVRRQDMTKLERKAFRDDFIERYGFPLDERHRNALEHVEGVRDDKYVPGKRVDGPLAALCHAADNMSARAFYDHGRETALADGHRGLDIDKQWSPLALRLLLDAYNVPHQQWGYGGSKTFDSLLHEVNMGETKFEFPIPGELRRVIEGVWVDVLHIDSSGNVWRLVEVCQQFTDGRIRSRDHSTSLGEKLQLDEDRLSAVKRALREEMGINSDCDIYHIGDAELLRDDGSYPGLSSRLIHHDYVAVIPAESFRPGGYVERQPDKTTYFSWTLSSSGELERPR